MWTFTWGRCNVNTCTSYTAISQATTRARGERDLEQILSGSFRQHCPASMMMLNLQPPELEYSSSLFSRPLGWSTMLWNPWEITKLTVIASSKNNYFLLLVSIYKYICLYTYIHPTHTCTQIYTDLHLNIKKIPLNYLKLEQSKISVWSFYSNRDHLNEWMWVPVTLRGSNFAWFIVYCWWGSKFSKAACQLRKGWHSSNYFWWKIQWLVEKGNPQWLRCYCPLSKL